MDLWTIQHADALTALRTLPDASVDSVVTDPPSGTGFMGVAWDTYGEGKGKAATKDRWDQKGTRWNAQDATKTVKVARQQGKAFREGMEPVFAECLRVLKPGGHALVWALPRTSHWTATALDDAGFEIRDSLHHLFGSGFPKSMDVSKAIDKAAGAVRPIVGVDPEAGRRNKATPRFNGIDYANGEIYQGATACPVTAPATNTAKTWDGWGTALKPSHEVWWLCRKPLAAKTVAAQVLDTGTGALNINACRVESDAGFMPKNAEGRWPSNLLLSHAPTCDLFTCTDDCPVAELDRQSGVLKSGGYPAAGGQRTQKATYGKPTIRGDALFGASEGGASRFFPTFRYQAKPSRSERNAGLEGFPTNAGRNYAGGPLNRPEHVSSDGAHRTGERAARANSHPTVKSVALMRWLCRLITPPGGLVADMFMGSGTTGVACAAEGFRFWGCDDNAEYIQIATARVSAAYNNAEEAAS